MCVENRVREIYDSRLARRTCGVVAQWDLISLSFQPLGLELRAERLSALSLFGRSFNALKNAKNVPQSRPPRY